MTKNTMRTSTTVRLLLCFLLPALVSGHEVSTPNPELKFHKAVADWDRAVFQDCTEIGPTANWIAAKGVEKVFIRTPAKGAVPRGLLPDIQYMMDHDSWFCSFLFTGVVTDYLNLQTYGNAYIGNFIPMGKSLFWTAVSPGTPSLGLPFKVDEEATAAQDASLAPVVLWSAEVCVMFWVWGGPRGVVE